MDKTIIKKFGPGILIVIAVILIISTFLKNDSSAIVGKWELAPTESNAVEVYEFHKDNTGVQYNVFKDGDAYDTETFSYRLYDSKITIDMFGVSRVYSYELSGKNLLIDNKLYGKSKGASGIIPWVRYLLAIACLIFAILIGKEDVVTIAEKIKKEDPEVEAIGKTSTVSREKKAETATKESDDRKKDDVKIKSETEVSPTKIHSELGTTFRAKMDDVNEKEGSKETKGDWFKSAGDL